MLMGMFNLAGDAVKDGKTTTAWHRQAASGCGMLVLTVHAGLLFWSATQYSPTQDEMAHLPSGLAIWRFGTFDLYRVNPPLVRALAALPVWGVDHAEDWTTYRPGAEQRAEWDVGSRFVVANGLQSYSLFTLARWACLPLSLWGAWICWTWARELTTEFGGLIALSLWCFSPNVLGHGSLITPDIPATSIGLWAAYRLRLWLQRRDWWAAFIAGIAIGMAVLTKSYWILLVPAWPVVAAISCALSADSDRNPQRESGWRAVGSQLLTALMIGLSVLNLGYAYDGTFRRLKEYGFYSASLSGETRHLFEELPGNRFRGTWLGEIPVPLPKEFVRGIDLQKLDFEQGKWGYLLGETREQGGWWYYYLVGLWLKVPVGTWMLVAIGFVTIVRHRKARSILIRTLPLTLPGLALFVLASSQTGMNRHVRYVFPVLPSLYLVGAHAALCPNKLIRRVIAPVALGATVMASWAAYPHCLSFVNWSVGGPRQGHHYLVDTNLDWGQDLIHVREWLAQHPDRRPVSLAWLGYVPLESLGIDAEFDGTGDPRPGWRLISVHLLHEPRERWADYLQREPVERIGGAINVYQIPD